MAVRLDNRVAVVTGAGGGLGRLYAIHLAALGAKVVVNDVGASLQGDANKFEQGQAPAQKVVDEIKAKGGVAVPNFDSVEYGSKIIETAINHFGKVDILINNAGILRDRSVNKMTDSDFDAVVAVHLKGSFSCTKAAWPYMMKQQYGRILNISSPAGLYGNFGQLNYSSAKGALITFTKTLALEGAKRNVHSNCMAPLAATRMTETIMNEEMLTALKPDHPAVLASYLVSEACKENGQVFEAGAGWVSKLRWNRTKGHLFPAGYTAEDIHKNWNKIVDFTEGTYPDSTDESTRMLISLTLDPEKVQLKYDDTVKKSESKSTKIFKMMEAYLQNFKHEGKKLVEKVNCIFEFNIVPKIGDKPKAIYTVNLKDGSGSITEGKHSSPTVVFTITDEDFVLVCLGKINPQVAFLRKKLMVKGSMKDAGKFNRTLFPPITMAMLEIDSATAINNYLAELNKLSGTTSTGSTSALKSAPLFDMIQKHMETPAGKAAAKKVDAIYRLDIIPNKGEPPVTFALDLKSDPPKAYKGVPPKSDAHFTMTDEDFLQIMQGKLNPQKAYMQGKMKVKGSMAKAMKFNPTLFPTVSRL